MAKKEWDATLDELAKDAFNRTEVNDAWIVAITGARNADKSVEAELTQTRAWLKHIQDTLVFPADGGGWTDLPCMEVAKSLWEVEAKAAASAAIRAAREAGTSPLADASAAMKQRLTDGRGAVSKAQSAAAKLANGHTVDELRKSSELPTLPPSGKDSPALTTLLARCASIQLAQLDKVLAIESLTSITEVLKAAEAAESNLGIIRSALRQVKDLQTALTPDELKRITPIAAKITKAIAGAPEAQLPEWSLDHRITCMAIVARSFGREQISDTLVDAGRGLLQAAGCDLSSPETPAYLKFNVALRQAKLDLGDKPNADNVNAVANLLLSAAGPQSNDAATLAKILTDLAAATQPVAPPTAVVVETPGPDLASSGPGARGWSMNMIGNDAARVEFNAPASLNISDPTCNRLEFVRLPDSQTYLCTVELPVGLFVNLAATDSNGFRPLMPKLQIGNTDPRSGVRTWAFDKASRGSLGLASMAGKSDASSWLKPGSKLRYAEGMPLDPPSSASPVQYVSLRAAARVAAILGCRLPSAGEWAQASRINGPSITGSNRRDETWRSQAKVWPSTANDPLTAAVFLPLEVSDSSRDAAVSYADGTLWFTTVNGGPTAATFKNLEGNVAEWTYESPSDFDRVLSQADAAEKAVAIASQRPEVASIIGASALSPAAVVPDRAYPNPRKADDVTGFADVGLRLCFTATQMRAVKITPAPNLPATNRLDEAAKSALSAINGLKYRSAP